MSSVDSDYTRQAEVSAATEITYRLDRDVDAGRIVDVYRSVGWHTAPEDEDLLVLALRSSAAVSSAWDGQKAVGVARMLSDGVFQAFILEVAVRPEHNRRGIGTRLVKMLVDSNPSLHFHLRTSSRRFSFYERLGFVRDETGMERFPERR